VLKAPDVDERVYIGAQFHELVLVSDPVYPQFIIDLAVVLPGEHSSSKYAVLISGGWTPQDAWPSFWNDLKMVYSVLVEEYFYDPVNIYVLYNDGVGEDSQIPVHYAATTDKVSLVLDELADIMDSGDRLLFYATDHGGWYGDGGKEPTAASTDLDEYICLWNKGGYYDDWLDEKLDAINYSKAIIILDLCHSGGFTWDLSGDDRIIMTACKEAELSYDHPDAPNGDFTYNLFNALRGYWWAYADLDNNGRVSVAEAFNYAAANSISIQTATYDDNGDGVAHFNNIPNGGPVEDEGRLGNTYL
ncbi:MAG TPA: C13 family peptidase, partial [Methanomassiliicoccales archaeon]|nr:C13 family peptidase [Methanomassiliicoccales archaeon]